MKSPTTTRSKKEQDPLKDLTPDELLRRLRRREVQIQQAKAKLAEIKTEVGGLSYDKGVLVSAREQEREVAKAWMAYGCEQEARANLAESMILDLRDVYRATLNVNHSQCCAECSASKAFTQLDHIMDAIFTQVARRLVREKQQRVKNHKKSDPKHLTPES
jgi:hypothetical protein